MDGGAFSLFNFYCTSIETCVWGVGELENGDLRCIEIYDHCLAISESLYSKKVHCCGDPITRVNVFGPGDATYIRGVMALIHLKHSAFIKAVGRSTLKFIVIFRLVGKLTKISGCVVD